MTLADPPAAFTNSDGEVTCPSCHEDLPGTPKQRLRGTPSHLGHAPAAPCPTAASKTPEHDPLCAWEAAGPELMPALWFCLRPSLQWVSMLLLCSFQWHFHLFSAFGNTILPLKPEKHFAVVLRKERKKKNRHTIVFAWRSLSFLKKKSPELQGLPVVDDEVP